MGSFLVTYRWELWLIVGIPVTTYIVQAVSVWGYYFGYSFGLLTSGNAAIDSYYFVGSVAGTLLLAVSYLRVRNLGRDFFALLWGYVVLASVVGIVAGGDSSLLGVVFPGAENLIFSGRTLSILGLAMILHILVLLWFARRASRFSLMHAVFLLVYSSLNVVGTVTGSTILLFNTDLLLASILVGSAIWLTVVLTKVWLLGNFDRRGPRFRRNAVIGLLATLILSGYARVAIAYLIGYAEGPYTTILPLLGVLFGLEAFIATTVFELVFLIVLWGLVYLVRVRPPTAYAELEAEASTAEPGEGR